MTAKTKQNQEIIYKPAEISPEEAIPRMNMAFNILFEEILKLMKEKERSNKLN